MEARHVNRRSTNRKGWIAGLLSLVLSGLGQLYSGSWRRALGFFLGEILAALAALLLFVHLRAAPANLVLSAFVYLGYRIWNVVDAVRATRRASTPFQRGWPIRWGAYLLLIGWFWYWGSLHIALVMRDTVVEAFRLVDTRSMLDTLMPGDRFLVDKLFYSDPKRRDVVLYALTDSSGEDYTLVKRIIGLPGEHIEIRGTRVIIDGEALEEPYLRLDGKPLADRGPWTVPCSS